MTTATLPTAPMTTEQTRARVSRLVELAERWQIIPAIEELYDDDVEVSENLNPPTVGKSANLERERGFVAWVAEVREMRAALVLVDGDRSLINWHQDLVGTDGKHLVFDQLALQEWKDGRIVRERFVYDPATLAR